MRSSPTNKSYLIPLKLRQQYFLKMEFDNCSYFLKRLIWQERNSIEDVSLLVIKTRSHDAEGNNGRKQTICHVSSSSSNISLSLSLSSVRWRESGSQAVLLFIHPRWPRPLQRNQPFTLCALLYYGSMFKFVSKYIRTTITIVLSIIENCIVGI